MSDMTTTRSTWPRALTTVQAPLAAGKKCVEGTRACIDTAAPNTVVMADGTTTTLKPLGRFTQTVDNSAGGSAVNVQVVLDIEIWCTNWDSVTGANAVTIANRFSEVNLASNHEVTTAGTGSAAGRVFDVNGEGVWIHAPTLG
jgi:hypothetical protein